MNISHNGREVSSNCLPIPHSERGCWSAWDEERMLLFLWEGDCGNHELEKVNLQELKEAGPLSCVERRDSKHLCWAKLEVGGSSNSGGDAWLKTPFLSKINNGIILLLLFLVILNRGSESSLEWWHGNLNSLGREGQFTHRSSTPQNRKSGHEMGCEQAPKAALLHWQGLISNESRPSRGLYQLESAV